MSELVMSIMAVVSIAAFSGVLGSVILWRSMAYYGDAMAHAALLGVALALIFPHLPVLALVFAVVFAATYCTQFFEMRFTALSPNTLLGIFAHAALATGILLSHLYGASEADIHDWLLGDMHAIARNQMLGMIAGSVLGLLVLYGCWNKLILCTLSEALAQIEGVRVARLKLVLLMLLSLFITLALPVAGVLLVTALLILPAAIARLVSITPNSMALFSMLIAMGASVAGIVLAHRYDLPQAPMVVALLGGLFASVAVAHKLKH